ncbi:MAG: putative sugar nucleotidyl transferase [Thermofilaceae archaeon]|nr:putative sugar nucleotidyl transferase [Thermofilaceae archaeon]MCX8180122.1 putative sugar nucleotidyl transferase [Thermofilaceae archaeon]MDW8004222.1 putative sugar nucleotidyl transferase [Thermofilaceae archaeon]
MQVAIFEDELVNNFLPLTYTKAVFDLRVGRFTLVERISSLLGKVDLALVRSHLAEYYRLERDLKTRVDDIEDDLLLVNARYALDEETLLKLGELNAEKKGVVLVQGGYVIGAAIPYSIAKEAIGTHLDILDFLNKVRGCLPILEVGDARALLHLWDLIEFNSDVLAKDLGRTGRLLGEVDETVKIFGRDKVTVEEKAVIEPYVVLDARGGPILVEEGAHVKTFAYVEGPAYIAKGTVIMPGARVRSGCSIGPVCRVGGEVEESIIHGYSNKYHDGFLGHAYVGEWVNLGALTTNSDLKNTYGTVRMSMSGGIVDTKLTKIGSFIADFAKTSIGTLIYTGKRVGVASHLHGLVHEDVPSFTIYAKSLGCEPVELTLESAIKTATRMMERRGVSLSNNVKHLLERVFYLTRPERERQGVRGQQFKLAVKNIHEFT